MVGASTSEASGEGNGLSNILPQKRQLSFTSSCDEVMIECKRNSTILMDLEILDCPICFEPLKIPIFQCDNGHLVCSSCCLKLRDKNCHTCALPIGDKRCRAMENVIESISIPCPNAKFGCTMSFSYGNDSNDESTHMKECIFSPCSCPIQCCNYTGSYSSMYGHFISDHSKKYNLFYCDVFSRFRMNISDKILIRLADGLSLLFVVQCFRETYGVYVTVSCIAPSSPQVGEFSYYLSYTVDGHTITYESPKVKKVLQVSFQTPQENFMMIPNSLLCGDCLEMKLCIKKLKQG